MARRFDIAIAGCGIAGLAAAALLARDGHRVTMFDRFDAPRPIGSGLMLQPTGLRILREIGVLDQALRHGATIARLVGESNGRKVLDVRYASLGRADGFGVGIHRAALFQILHRAAMEAGAIIVPGREISSTTLAGPKRWLGFADRRQDGPFDLVIDALGTNSSLTDRPGRLLAYGALWANVRWPAAGEGHDALSQRYRRASMMAGVLPIGTRPDSPIPMAALFWSLRADQHQSWLADGLEKWKEQWLDLWPQTADFVEQITSAEQLTFARYTHRTLKRPAAAALIHIGDSWHSTSPQLGQGANMGLLDAFALALAVRRSSTIDLAVRDSVEARKFHVRLYQLLSIALTPVYQSDNRLIPAIRDRLVGPLSSLWPIPQIQATLVAGLAGRPLHRLGLDR